MNSFVTSLIRTWVPIVVGALASYLLTLEVELDAEAQAGLVVGLTAVLQGAYYLIVRVLESRYPKLGVLLGSEAKPKYVDQSTNLLK